MKKSQKQKKYSTSKMIDDPFSLIKKKKRKKIQNFFPRKIRAQI